MLAIIAGIAVGIMVAIGGARDGDPTNSGVVRHVGGSVLGQAEASVVLIPDPVHWVDDSISEDAGSTRLVLGALSADGTPEPGVTAAAVEPTRDIGEPTPVPVGDAVERWRPLVASIFPEFAVDAVLRVIRCESGGDPNATGHAGERGLLQIHPQFHPDSTYDPEGNLRAGYRISSGGTDWSAWTCQP